MLLTGEFAYKIKRPLPYPFVDQRSFAQRQRQRLCAEELRLNRRFAPQLYVGVCPITLVNGAARMDGPGVQIKHAVKMRQFSRDDELDRLLAAGRSAPTPLHHDRALATRLLDVLHLLAHLLDQHLHVDGDARGGEVL